MSLSLEPSVKITYLTSQEISDEILGGTIQFCRETGYKPNITMITFFWTAFLFSESKELRKYNLTEKVIGDYTYSLKSIFPQLKEDAQMRQKVDETCHQYWENLSKSFTGLRTERDLSKLFEIAEKLNAQGDNLGVNSGRDNCGNVFSRISSVIGSSIYGILREIDNGYTIRYKYVLDEIQYAQYKNNTSNTVQKSSDESVMSLVLKALGALFLGIISAEFVLMIIVGNAIEGAMALVLLSVVSLLFTAFYFWYFLRNSKKEERNRTVRNTDARENNGTSAGYCTNCGAQLMKGSQFCSRCGTKVVGS